VSRRTSFICTALAGLVCFVAWAPARGQERVARRSTWFDIAVEDGVEIKSKTCRAIEKEATAAIETGLALLGLDAKRVFYLGVPEPAWMGKPDKLRFLIVEEPSRRRQGIDYWLTQLHAGGFTIELPVPGETLSEEFRRCIRREVGAALLGNTLFKGSVPWWTTGVMRVLEESCTETPSPEVQTARAGLSRLPPEKLEKKVKAVLAAERVKNLPEELGREISYFLVDLLRTAHPELLKRMQRQMQTMAYHLLHFPDELSLRRDFVAMLREQLTGEAGQSVPVITEALQLWAEEGWRQGRAFRKTKLARRYRNTKLPQPFDVEMKGRWGKALRDDSGQVYYVFDNGQVTWRLPRLGFKSELRTGLHKKLPRGKKFKPDDLLNGLGIPLDKWSGIPSGRRKYAARQAYYRGPPMHYNWMLLDIVSGNRVTYRFYRYWKR